MEVVKCLVGRPKKELQAILLIPKVKKPKGLATKKAKLRGKYTIWFMPYFWGPIHVAMRVHKNYTSTVNYLQTKYKLPTENGSVHDDLTRDNFYIWFTPFGDLKERVAINKTMYIYIDTHTHDEKSSFTKGSQHKNVLAKFLELEEHIIEMLQGLRDVGHLFLHLM